MAKFDDKALEEYEHELVARSALCVTKDQREILMFMVAMVQWMRTTLKYTNGAVRLFAAPLGVLGGLYLFGTSAVDWAADVARGWFQ